MASVTWVERESPTSLLYILQSERSGRRTPADGTGCWVRSAATRFTSVTTCLTAALTPSISERSEVGSVRVPRRWLTSLPLLLSHEIDGVRKEKERLTAAKGTIRYRFCKPRLIREKEVIQEPNR